ncbi:SDR family NAD(P)-dependent oxidoreductase [Nocardia pseudovaccinii]|uniref:SDR family NAD(P)-dependent oxidoreductase n=1 Tax=Nocardia pseudovaccinii TaxID=189540 RepID=UPI000B1B9B92|nr:SDR family oxidoreductase [Nocardia pseudovaccinii]
MADSLTGKIALVTGGSRGIGAGIVGRLAAEGADIAFTYRTDEGAADAVAERVRSRGRRVVAIAADLCEAAAVARTVEATLAEFGGLDILVNNAGITHWGSIAQTALTDFDRLVAVDARAPFLMMQAVADRLSDEGRIVNISSGVTAMPLPGMGLYSGAKAFVDQITMVAALEFAARRITVNAVNPGSVASGPFAHLSEEQLVQAGSAFALGRMGQPQDVAGVVAFLSSADAGFITGQIIYCAGGQTGPVRRN